VQIAQGGQLLADPALVNTPLFEGMQVLTSEDGRAELEFDDGSVIRLSPDSSLMLTVLRGDGGSGSAEIELSSGLGYFELQGGSAGNQTRVRFGDAVVTASGFTVLRVNLDNPPGELAVFSGNAHLERGRSVALDLHGGQSVTLNASDPVQYLLAESIEPDSWDTWNSDRDQSLTALAATRTGAANSLPESNNPAWNDLDANGNWYNVPGTGSVWSPLKGQTLVGIPTATVTGCGRRALAISGSPATPGVICLSSAGLGIFIAISAGDGRRECVRHGGAAAGGSSI
jgi:hypothetical protein